MNRYSCNVGGFFILFFAAGGRSGALFCEGETYGFSLALPFP